VNLRHCCLAWLCLLLHAIAHPVAQGSAEVEITAHALHADFRVSNEQIFVASTFGANAAPAASLADLWPQHAAYLLAHLHVTADGTPLAGELVQITPPEDPTIKGFTRYTLRFPFPAAPPQAVVLRQDLLREIEFAPGNPWEASFVVRVTQEGRVLHAARLLAPQQPLELPLEWGLAAAFSAPARSSLGQLARDFFQHGLRHILAGWDHALFVAALVLAVARLGPIIALITAFTLAHTVTLTLGVLGWVALPRSVVEPTIAASIIAAALLNLRRPGQAPLPPRLAVAFGFGLIHGLGFASGLSAAMAGFPAAALAVAIGAFSVGVEVGHQAIVLPLIIALLALRHSRPALVPRVTFAGSVLIAALGGYWLLAAWP
jgi:hypothetical protein